MIFDGTEMYADYNNCEKCGCRVDDPFATICRACLDDHDCHNDGEDGCDCQLNINGG